MINTNSCCGCTACIDVCPVNAIKMTGTPEGFLAAEIECTKCVDCGRCDSVCPMNTGDSDIQEERECLEHFFAYKADLETRMNSTSGGIFQRIARWWIQRGGVVFGASMDEKLRVVYSEASTIDELVPILKTKYVQAEPGNTFSKALSYLQNGTNVLFCGNPCVTEGLRNFVQMKREGQDGFGHLLLVDHICAGVPSPGLWKQYVKYLEERNGGGKLDSFEFRAKDRPNGGHTAAFLIDGQRVTEEFLENKWCRIYSKSLGLRETCYHCKWASPDRASDLTIGDFWGIEKVDPAFDDGYGVSAVITHTAYGLQVLTDAAQTDALKEVSKEAVLQPRLQTPPKASMLQRFWKKDILQNGDVNHCDIELILKKYGS